MIYAHDATGVIAISQDKRKHVEEPFGWAKTVGGFARPTLRGVVRAEDSSSF